MLSQIPGYYEQNLFHFLNPNGLIDSRLKRTNTDDLMKQV